MPKYTVSEVLDIIKNLKAEDKLELQQQLPSILDAMTTPATDQPTKSSSQNIEGININSGNSDITLNQIQADRVGSVSQSGIQATLQNADWQTALNALEKLKQDIETSNVLNLIEKKSLEVPLQTIEEELKKSKPDKSLVEQAIEVLKKGITGVAELAEPLMKLISLVAKIWE